MAEIRLAIRNSALQHCKLQLDQKLLTKPECDEKSMAEIVKVAALMKITNRSVYSELKAHFSHLVGMVEHMFKDHSDDTTGTAVLSCPCPEFPTLQSAIDGAPHGAIIHVEPGVYYEQLVIDKKVIIKGRSNIGQMSVTVVHHEQALRYKETGGSDCESLIIGVLFQQSEEWEEDLLGAQSGGGGGATTGSSHEAASSGAAAICADDDNESVSSENLAETFAAEERAKEERSRQAAAKAEAAASRCMKSYPVVEVCSGSLKLYNCTLEMQTPSGKHALFVQKGAQANIMMCHLNATLLVEGGGFTLERTGIMNSKGVAVSVTGTNTADLSDGYGGPYACAMVDNTISGCKDTAVWARRGAKLSIENTRIDECGEGIMVDDSNTHVRCVRCTMEHCSGNGVSVMGGAVMEMEEGTVNNCGGDGFSVMGEGTDGAIDNCTVKHCRGHGVFCSGDGLARINDNKVQYNAKTAIHVSDKAEARVTNNILSVQPKSRRALGTSGEKVIEEFVSMSADSMLVMPPVGADQANTFSFSEDESASGRDKLKPSEIASSIGTPMGGMSGRASGAQTPQHWD